MFGNIITSKTRIKLLFKFFSNPQNKGYLREIAKEFGESTNAVRVELNRLSQAGLLGCIDEGRTKVYFANKSHLLFPEISSMVKKLLGVDLLADLLADKVDSIGNVKMAAVLGEYTGESDALDVLLVGEINHDRLQHLTEKAQELLQKKINITTLEESAYLKCKGNYSNRLLIWGEDI